ncbi:MAG: hemerythrin domain-containing protein [Muribaculaceae bacterium]|nr:hemerythrin domain-containing protein [Muribaculaceae bacterium]
MKKLLYDSSMKMSELISAEPGLVLILQRVGLALGFGDKSIGTVCAQHGVDADFFLLLCNIYTHEGYVPERERILSTSMEPLVPYLRQSHDYYVTKRLPHIERHLHRIAEHVPERVATVLMRFFKLYMREVVEHFAHEEQMVYPHVEALQRGEHDSRYTIANFVEQHGNLEDKLSDLVQIIFKYLPEEATTDDAVDVVYDILQVSNDLNKHSLIEEKVLVPYVKHLEKEVQVP